MLGLRFLRDVQSRVIFVILIIGTVFFVGGSFIGVSMASQAIVTISIIGGLLGVETGIILGIVRDVRRVRKQLITIAPFLGYVMIWGILALLVVATMMVTTEIIGVDLLF